MRPGSDFLEDEYVERMNILNAFLSVTHKELSINPSFLHITINAEYRSDPTRLISPKII